VHNKGGIAQWSRGSESGPDSNLGRTEGTGGLEGTEGSGFQGNILGKGQKRGKNDQKTRNLALKPISQGVYKGE